jgi:hypothetical protein
MKKYGMVVDVPKIDEAERAYNHHRPISTLILHQLRHLHAAEQHLPERDRTGINISRLHTELEASEYIQKVTPKLRAAKPSPGTMARLGVKRQKPPKASSRSKGKPARPETSQPTAKIDKSRTIRRKQK